MQRVRVGVIGLGQVAQITHLPILEQLSDRYEIAAVCDVSPGLVAAIGDRYRVPGHYTDAAAMIQQTDLDAVFVLNSDEYHAEHTILAARAGKHVLVEKPMCLTMREVDEIVAARDAGGIQVMVGYMRRFAPAFVHACAEVRALDHIRYARIRDIIGGNALIIEQVVNVEGFDDIPAAARLDRTERAQRLVAEAIGDAPPDIVTAYRLLLGLASHDLSAMRELIGMPQRVVAASQWHGGRYMSAILDFGDFHATFEMGVDRQRRFDAHLEVYGDTRQIRVQYDTPYIRHLPTTMIIGETIGEEYRETVHRPTFKDPYTHELEIFHDVAAGKSLPKTPPEDFRHDLALFRDIINRLRESA